MAARQHESHCIKAGAARPVVQLSFDRAIVNITCCSTERRFPKMHRAIQVEKIGGSEVMKLVKLKVPGPPKENEVSN